MGGISTKSSRDRHLVRPRLVVLSDEAIDRRLTTIVAGPGYGKSTLLNHWGARHDHLRLDLLPGDRNLNYFARRLVRALSSAFPALSSRRSAATVGDDVEEAESFAIAICEVLHDESPHEALLVFDDTHEVPVDSASARVLDAIVRNAPSFLHIVVASRSAPPLRVEGLRGREQLLSIDSSSLAFTREEVRELLTHRSLDPSMEGVLHEITEGWPAALTLCLDALSRTEETSQDDLLASLTKSGVLFNYLAEEVVSDEPPRVQKLLEKTAPLDRFTPPLCRFLGVEDAEMIIDDLASRRVLVEPVPGARRWYRSHGLVRAFVRQRYELGPDEESDILRRAAQWLETQEGLLDEALELILQLKSEVDISEFLERNGETLLDQRDASLLLRAFQQLSPPKCSSRVRLLAARALLDVGDDAAAADLLERQASQSDDLYPSVGSRLADIYARQDDIERVRSILQRTSRTDASATDLARLHFAEAWVLALEGSLIPAAEGLVKSSEAAKSAGNDHLQAAALGTLSEVHSHLGNHEEAQSFASQAFDIIEGTGDDGFIQRSRVHAARIAAQKSRYAEALEEAEAAIRATEKVADMGPGRRGRLLVKALWTRGAALLRLGRIEEGMRDLQECKAHALRHRPSMVGLALLELADVFRQRGDTALARSTYADASRRLADSGRHHDWIHAEVGLASVSIREDPQESLTRMRSAISELRGPDGWLYLDAGWIELLLGDREKARSFAGSAMQDSSNLDNSSMLAAALELSALVEDPPRSGLLREASVIYGNLGERIGEARALYAASRLSPEPSEQVVAIIHQKNLAALGVRLHPVGIAGLLAALPGNITADVVIQTLGGFALTVRGETLSTSSWPSKKSRDLLKMLISRRGATVHREILIDLMWPGKDTDELANRFSVELSKLRSIFDPHRRRSNDYYIRTDDNSVSLNLGNVSIDIERFVTLADRGLKGVGELSLAERLGLLEEAEALYIGNFLEEDVYADWTIAPREQALALFIAVESFLATHSSEEGDLTAATRRYLRILELDPYDEAAHFGLIETAVRAGRHGEARRYYRGYIKRMREIEVEPAPFPIELRYQHQSAPKH